MGFTKNEKRWKLIEEAIETDWRCQRITWKMLESQKVVMGYVLNT